ncbi:Endoglucanase [Arthrobotrys entomopaga]|nr:Endoglucanase [Arthrobotrys entomopaga]
MKSSFVVLAGLAGLIQKASAQSQGYGQCGGSGWNGPTSCVSGWTCTYSNPYYSQCLPGGNNPPVGGNTVTVYSTVYSTVTTTTTRIQATTVTSTETDYETVTETTTVGGGDCTATGNPQPSGCDASGTFSLFGVNEAGAEFGTAIPGTLGKDYTWPTFDSVDYFLDAGFNAFRIPIMLERAAPPDSGLDDPSTYDQSYLSGLYQIVSYITSKGGQAIIDIHNFGRYNGDILTDVSGFGIFWHALSAWTAFSPNVVFDLMNEYHDMDDSLVFQLNQAGLSAIRGNNLTNLILVEGNSWSGAWTWRDNNDMLKYLTDFGNNMAFEMHQYLDSDGSGTSDECVSDTIGAERVADAISWCEENDVQCFLGEYAGGDNDVCLAAVSGMLCAIKSSPNWIGATWWAAGPWWPSDTFSNIEPPSGAAVADYVPLLQSFQ